MDKKLQKIREKCIEANPKDSWLEYGQEVVEDTNGNFIASSRPRPIRLADVLLAIRKFVEENGEPQDKLIYSLWNPKDNNLENQSEETIEFIYRLLK